MAFLGFHRIGFSESIDKKLTSHYALLITVVKEVGGGRAVSSLTNKTL